jgi:hypothetical protein
LEKEWVTPPLGDGWSNQIPVASGFTGSHEDSKRAIDLGWDKNKETAVFVELKWETDHPIYAAFEIFNYGMLYLFARRFLTADYRTSPWMGKEQILLTVLAPAAFYKRYPPETGDWLGRSLNSAVATLAADHTEDPFKMGFCFSKLPESLQEGWTEDDLTKTILSVESDLTEKMNGLFTLQRA